MPGRLELRMWIADCGLKGSSTSTRLSNSQSAIGHRQSVVFPAACLRHGRRRLLSSCCPAPQPRGLPDSVAFWKVRVGRRRRAELRGPYHGPSGCGKSSLLKAGLLPRLAHRVVPICLEASPEGTEAALLQALRRRLPALPPDLDLAGILHALRLGRGLAAGQKVLLVIDQFEQWLHAPRGSDDRTLVEALRQCDGARVQTLLLVRDDFWMPVSQFLHELDERLVEGENAAAVDLFSLAHAQTVLTEFGRAHLRLPALPAEPSREQAHFVEQAVTELGEQGKVVPVRLALFVEMVKHRPWTPATLRAIGAGASRRLPRGNLRHAGGPGGVSPA